MRPLVRQPVLRDGIDLGGNDIPLQKILVNISRVTEHVKGVPARTIVVGLPGVRHETGALIESERTGRTLRVNAQRDEERTRVLRL